MTDASSEYDHANHGYALERVIGATPEADRVTWRAIHIPSGDAVVVKAYGFSTPSVGWDGYQPDQAEALLEIRHERVPRYRELYRRSDDTGFYLVQDFRPAAKLHTGVRWPQRVAVRIAEQLLEVMVHLEDRVVPPIVHRDLAPQNILLRPVSDQCQVDVLLVDFLVVRHQLGALLPNSRAAGAPGFNAPEELRGAPVDSRCDLFSLGMTVACLVAGIHEAEVRTLRGDGELLPARLPDDLDPRLVDWLLAMTAEDPNDRPHHARTALKRLRLFAETLPDGPVPAPLPEPKSAPPTSISDSASPVPDSASPVPDEVVEAPRGPSTRTAVGAALTESAVANPDPAAKTHGAPVSHGDHSGVAGDFFKAMALLFGIGILVILAIVLIG